VAAGDTLRLDRLGTIMVGDVLRRMVEVHTFPEPALARGGTWAPNFDIDAAPIGTMKVAFEMDASVDDSDISGRMFFAIERGYLTKSSLNTSYDLFMSAAGQESEEVAHLKLSAAIEQHILRIGEDDPPFE
jgi:hypothetical protein